MVLYNFKTISVVPSSRDLVDIVLSRTQRKTPTVIHNGYAISRIRRFYMRKVRFTQESFHDKLSCVLSEFPRLDELHPFYGDLVNVLYSRDHYKLALAQLSTARSLIANIGSDYLKLLKFADSLYRCKELKRAGLGRMCSLAAKLTPSLAYLEQVRQHLSRLPSIDPNTRTLLITGCPNTGKSSFLNSTSRANVEVQPYAFTTKSLFVGHADYRYVRWQLVDTPGLLDHALEERNVIEMQAVTALAHLHCTVLFFVDASEQCGFSLRQQASLFHSLSPLFANKPLLIVCNKADLRRLAELEADDRQLIDAMLRQQDGAQLVEMSALTAEGVNGVMQAGCDLLLQHRVEKKLKSRRAAEVINRISVAVPVKRDDKVRAVSIPASVLKQRELRAAARKAAGEDEDGQRPLFTTDFRAELRRPVLDPLTGERRRTLRDVEQASGGAGVFSFDHRAHHLLQQDDWRWDAVPELMDGKNVADFVDADIERQLALLEQQEEEEMQSWKQRGGDEQMRDDGDDEAELDDAEQQQVAVIRQRRQLVRAERVLRHSNNKPVLPRAVRARQTTLQAVGQSIDGIGLDSSRMRERSRSRSRPPPEQRQAEAAAGGGRGRKRGRDEADADRMEVEPSAKQRALSVLRSRSESRDRSSSHRVNVPSPFRDAGQRLQAGRLRAVQGQRKANRQARVGESDRRVYDEKPKHLFSGKRGIGKTTRR